jgi:14-3-3 protein epsilon
MVVPTNGDLTIEERNLLSVAYKNVVGSRRASWRTLQIEDALAAQYRIRVENELETICKEVLALLESRLLQVGRTGSEEAAVFYLKMTADYYRYMSEFKPKPQGDAPSPANSEGMAGKYYEEAMVLATDKLPATHPIRLGLALNYSVCHYEILRNPKAACALAKSAFDEAIKKLDQLDEASYKDSTLIMQLLRDNLTLWTSESQQDLQVEDVQNS